MRADIPSQARGFVQSLAATNNKRDLPEGFCETFPLRQVVNWVSVQDNESSDLVGIEFPKEYLEVSVAPLALSGRALNIQGLAVIPQQVINEVAYHLSGH